MLLAKLVTAALAPLGTALLLGLPGLALAWTGAPARRRLGLKLLAFALGWLWLWSLPVASRALRASLEAQAGPARVEALPTAAAIVVLGGGMRAPRPPDHPQPDLGSAADRGWHAARLYRAGKAPLLVLSGGTLHEGEPPEAPAMRSFLADLGVPPAAMLLEPASGNTIQNAEHTAGLLRQRNIDKVLLVTSALHMRRARALFQREGITVIAAPTDFEVVDRPFRLRDLVPQADALEGSGRAFKELVGALVGR